MKKYDETTEFHIYTAIGYNLLPILVGRIHSSINSTEEDVIEEWRNKQPDIMKQLTQNKRYSVVNTLTEM